ncbi:VanW family protein [Clostridium sp. Marseille-P2415]|uniref:VanW family protein n=1 Tax=Clostridium sp. Marseille-P2415 TaxID=1805471 RepID=UPI0011158F95|nr:VanW family protein [Clostridium sp. Marseille-P2415]
MDKYRARRNKIRRRNRNIAYGVLILSALSSAWLLYSLVLKDAGRAGSESLKAGTKIEDSERMNALDEKLTAARVGQTDLTGLTVKEAEDTLEERYQWELAVRDGTDAVLMDNLLEPQLQSIRKQLRETPADRTQQYEIDYEAMREPFAEQVTELAKRWDKSAAGSELESFDKETGTYRYTKEQNGRSLNQEKLVEQLMDAVKEENYQAEIAAEFTETPPERTQAQAKEQYKVIGTFTTTTTDNKNRNRNISLAVESVNGLILKPGQEFSFNNTTGNRTREKGYQPAGAYRNGVLIEEPGGGVCQVSTTLYHAIIEGGFKTTERNAHSFAPSYVEKGQDAMVSFDGYAGPDLKFKNTSGHTIAVRAALEGRKLKISLVGLPVLEDGLKVTIRSEKVRDLEPPAPVYEENTALPYGTEKVMDKGTTGGVYKSYRVYKKGDAVIKEEPLHNSTYKGKSSVIQRNTTAIPAETLPEATQETQPQATEATEAPEVKGPGANIPKTEAAD